jgi:Tol biopolymer transport system component
MSPRRLEPKAGSRCTEVVHLLRAAAVAALASLLVACAAPVPRPSPSSSASPVPTRVVHAGTLRVENGAPIVPTELSGRIVFDDFEDLFAMDVDGSNVVTVAGDPAGPEFDGAWSPDGEWIVYRDSTRGINEDDEIAIARADGSERRMITNDPANDWGPDWSPDGSTIAFNSDRDGGRLRGYLVAPDGTNLRPMGIDAWVEYPSFSPDGTRIAFMGHQGSNYEIYVADIATGAVEQLTDSPGQDGWPSWSPDGSTIAFSSVRDDCRHAARADECWQTESVDDEHHDIWLIDPDGSNLRRATPESGQFVAWSPDSSYLLISGRALYVIRADGTGRLELRAEGIDRPLGGIPDWH